MSVEEFVSISEAKPEQKLERQVLLLSSCEIYEPKAIMRFTCACQNRDSHEFRHSRTQSQAHTQGSGNSHLSASSDWLLTAT